MADPSGSGAGPSCPAPKVALTSSHLDTSSDADIQNEPGLRHHGTKGLRLRPGERFTETINDYLDIFQDLQVSPSFHQVFWSDVIYRYRQGSRHLPFLKRGTEASIKNMTDDILRGYGTRIWGLQSTWRGNLAAGEEMLLYDKDGTNAR
jgi:hypothetical protein